MRTRPFYGLLFLLTLLGGSLRIGWGQTPQTPALAQAEAMTVYRGNLLRREHGLAPLKASPQLTDAARWFAWDSVVNRPEGFCGHRDTLGRSPLERARQFGYPGFAGAENALCGYVSPEQAIQSWYDSPPHRDNLLDPNSRETGVGYYRREDGRGYISQGFGTDPTYPPLVIENEAPFTPSPNVNLYIYDRPTGGGFAGAGRATQMRISNDRCLMSGASQPFVAEKPWTLTHGEGWRQVSVELMDDFNRKVTMTDQIYRGPTLPADAPGLTASALPQSSVTLKGLNGGGLPLVQFSLGWLADDTFGTFERLWGDGERIADPTARGGSAYRLVAGPSEASAWVWSTEFFRQRPMTAYFRLKVGQNTSPREVARIVVKAGAWESAPLSLRGTDFSAPNAYQEFPINFTHQDTDPGSFLIFQVWRSGDTEVVYDTTTIFTAPQPITPSLIWDVPGGGYRGQGIWVRYTDGVGHFSPIADAPLLHPTSITPANLSFLTAPTDGPLAPMTLTIERGCQDTAQRVVASVPWLQADLMGDTITVRADQRGLTPGVHRGELSLALLDSASAPLRVPVTLTIANLNSRIFLPSLLRAGGIERARK